MSQNNFFGHDSSKHSHLKCKIGKKLTHGNAYFCNLVVKRVQKIGFFSISKSSVHGGSPTIIFLTCVEQTLPPEMNYLTKIDPLKCLFSISLGSIHGGCPRIMFWTSLSEM